MAMIPLINSELMIEFIYTIIVVFFCLTIYFKTKESYDLTKHKGLQYFRNGFLLFGLSYLIRFLFFTLFFSSFKFGFAISRELLSTTFMVITGYLSTLAIFYLTYSSIWKKISNNYFLIVSHIVAIISALLIFFTTSHAIVHEILIYFQSLIIIVAIILSLSFLKKNNYLVKILHVLIFVSWLISLWAIVPENIISTKIKLILKIASIIIFMAAYFKVSKWIK